ncbi:MAG: sigma-70 family RNA polymerase sigma factor [Candidatus Brocadiae bacterium]|nr:sigma-70 family RNA polymerase sigma factor [Candidatus Brocadiia bacterium]
MEQGTIRQLYQEHGPALLLYARSLLRDVSAAEDVLQQVFVRLLEKNLPEPAEPRPYLFRAVRNGALNWRRDAPRDARLDAAAWFVSVPPGREEGDGERLRAALDALPEDQREVVVMKVWGGLTFEEVADSLGIPANTAASRWRYGLEKLKSQMAMERVR